MKKQLIFLIIGTVAAQGIYAFAQNTTTSVVPPDTGSDLIQFNNLTIQNISAEGGFTIFTAAAPAALSRCLNYEGANSATGLMIPCPVPDTTVYRIEVDSGTRLMLRNREAAKIADFAVGDQINAFGYYSQIFSKKDGAVRALVVRNLSKPAEKHFIQLNDVELVGKNTEGGATYFTVVQRQTYPCYDFGTSGAKGIVAPCPAGLKSFDSHPTTQGLMLPERIAPIVDSVRKYVLRVSPTTILIDRLRMRIGVADFSIGERLNIYGAVNASGEEIEADVIRNLSRPRVAPKPSAYEGIITQINQSDGSFVIRMRDGALITIESPYKVGAFVSVHGVLDELKNIISGVTSISFKNLTDTGAIPVVLEVLPGAGPVGTRVTLVGSGFTARGNNINFAGVESAVTNVPSLDGKTLSFTIPATPCAPNAFCAQKILEPGIYTISVTNGNGTSNVVKFQVSHLRPLSIITTSLPQAVEGEFRYAVQLEGQGGTDSYAWGISSGSLPPGLKLETAVCIVAPCKVPATIAGTPTTPGSYSFTVTLKSGSEVVSRDFTIIVVYKVSG